MTWPETVYVDPTAGVTLAPRPVTCPRCGIEKPHKSRRGLCLDCYGILTYAERAAWRAGA